MQPTSIGPVAVVGISAAAGGSLRLTDSLSGILTDRLTDILTDILTEIASTRRGHEFPHFFDWNNFRDVSVVINVVLMSLMLYY